MSARHDPDDIHNRLSVAFGTSVHFWPVIEHTPPRWYQRSARRSEARINAALASVGLGPITEAMRRTYWIETRKGQDYREDAGGYCWRCWAAALGLRLGRA